jgi:hypothetical protein
MDPIDAVICWVDSSDPVWRAVFEQYRHEAKESTATHASRFNNADELRYCLRSLKMHLPWLRKVWVVTMHQKPGWWVDSSYVTLISHDQIMPASALPTFNSLAIETCLHRIPGLSQRFLYLNDDFFFGRPVPETCFFNKQIMVLPWHEKHALPPAPRNVYEDVLFNTGMLLAQTFGIQPAAQVFYRPWHHAMPKTIGAYERTWELFPELMQATCHGRFRERSHIIHYMVNYVALLEQQAVVKPGLMTYKFYNSDREWNPDKNNALPHMLCINDIVDSDAFHVWARLNFPQPSWAEPQGNLPVANNTRAVLYRRKKYIK